MIGSGECESECVGMTERKGVQKCLGPLRADCSGFLSGTAARMGSDGVYPEGLLGSYV